MITTINYSNLKVSSPAKHIFHGFGNKVGIFLWGPTSIRNNLFKQQQQKKTYYGLNPTLLTNHPKEFLRRKIRCSLINDMNGPPNTGINIQCRYSKVYIFLQINLIANIFQTDV